MSNPIFFFGGGGGGGVRGRVVNKKNISQLSIIMFICIHVNQFI